MAKHFEQGNTGFYEVLNKSLEAAFNAGTTGTTIANSFGKTYIADEFVRFRESDQPELKDFNTFSEMRKDITEIGFSIMPVNEGGSWKALFEINKGGFLEGTSHITCPTNTWLNCGTTDTCPDMACNKGAAESEIAEIEFKDEYYNFCQCVSDLYNVTDKFVYGDRMNEYLGLNVTNQKNMAQAVIEKTLSAIEKSILRRDLYETYSDNGLVAVVETTGPVAMNGSNTIDLTWNTRTIFQHHFYAIFRPGGSTPGNVCTPMCERTTSLIGFVQAIFPGDIYGRKAKFGRAKDVVDNTVLLPQVSVQKGDLIVALGGTISQVTGGAFGGTTYNMYTPLSGIAAGQIAGYTLPGTCCNQNGIWNLRRLTSGINAGTITTYMGLNVNGAYSSLLKPLIYNDCCGQDPEQVATLSVDDILGMFEQVASAMDIARMMEWHPLVSNEEEIVMEMAQLTYRNVAKSVYDRYPSITAPKTTNLGDNGFVNVIVKPEDRMSLDLSGLLGHLGYKATIKIVKRGMPEGVIRVGPKSPYFMAVLKDLKGKWSAFNNGNFQKHIPLDLLGITGGILGSGDAYRNQYVFEKYHNCGVDEVYVAWKGQRKRAIYHIAPGTELLLQNVDYTKPLECGITCVPKSCNPCV